MLLHHFFSDFKSIRVLPDNPVTLPSSREDWIEKSSIFILLRNRIDLIFDTYFFLNFSRVKQVRKYWRFFIKNTDFPFAKYYFCKGNIKKMFWKSSIFSNTQSVRPHWCQKLFMSDFCHTLGSPCPQLQDFGNYPPHPQPSKIGQRGERT